MDNNTNYYVEAPNGFSCSTSTLEAAQRMATMFGGTVYDTNWVEVC